MKPIYTFILTQIFFASMGWLAGYDFDERGVVVAYCTMVSMVIGIGLTKVITELLK